VVFGFGRRACPGEHLADAVLWCAMVYILATFDILPPIDPVSGEVLTLNPQFSTGLGRYVSLL
jgi:cytochrome P450